MFLFFANKPVEPDADGRRCQLVMAAAYKNTYAKRSRAAAATVPGYSLRISYSASLKNIAARLRLHSCHITDIINL